MPESVWLKFKAHGFCPITPLIPVYIVNWYHRNPRHSQHIGHDSPVHGFGDKHSAPQDFGDDLIDRYPRIDQPDASKIASYPPVPSPQTLPVRHEAHMPWVSTKGDL